MKTIIGFIRPETNLIDLPAGWSINGDPINRNKDNWSRDCALLLLHDIEYKNSNAIAGEDRFALLVQHISTSSNEKIEQQEHLKKWGWRTAVVEEFSHLKGSYLFWREVCTLLSKENEAEIRKAIIRGMAKRYENSIMLSRLDSLAAWYVLLSLTSHTEEKFELYKNQYEKYFDYLTPQQREDLGNFTDRPEQYLCKLDTLAKKFVS